MGAELFGSPYETGDVIFFDKDGDGVMDHCGIYIGDGTYVHAQATASSVIESDYLDAKVIAVRRMVYTSGDTPEEPVG